MKSVKEVLNQYEEKPSADVWERLNARLDEEMPLTENVSRIHRVKAWKWVAAVLAVLVLGGTVSLCVFLQHRNNQDVVVENVAKNADNKLVESSDVVAGQEEIVESEIAQVEMQTEEEVPAKVVVENSVKEQNPQSPKPEAEITTKTNTPQVVLPSNSTLAKQLAADPVLKKLSEESVDWSMPVHLSIPNLFTPNNDGVNDFFVIEGLENYSSLRLVVRDKNNKVVYRNDAYKNTWGGENCPEGVYSYELTFLYNGIENQALGKVRILRS
ncbi:MAG: gliding motility-associated C-terminal domain-containing protein [Bacteroidales bacterium]|nr:gliding motility-associated C-terminal domain-containing protein [Bacteroidales bacterium]